LEGVLGALGSCFVIVTALLRLSSAKSGAFSAVVCAPADLARTMEPRARLPSATKLARGDDGPRSHEEEVVDHRHVVTLKAEQRRYICHLADICCAPLVLRG
jgi:hypothetical protein